MKIDVFITGSLCFVYGKAYGLLWGPWRSFTWLWSNCFFLFWKRLKVKSSSFSFTELVYNSTAKRNRKRNERFNERVVISGNNQNVSWCAQMIQQVAEDLSKDGKLPLLLGFFSCSLFCLKLSILGSNLPHICRNPPVVPLFVALCNYMWTAEESARFCPFLPGERQTSGGESERFTDTSQLINFFP